MVSQWILVLLTLWSTNTSLPQEAGLLEGQHLEWIAQEPEQAIEHYRQTAESSDAAAEDRAEAYVGWVRCLLKLQRTEEARRVEQLLPQELLQDNKQKISALFAMYTNAEAFLNNTPPSGARIQGLIDQLGDPAQVDGVYEMLRSLGDVAVPYLIYTSRHSMNPKVVDHCMGILADRIRNSDDNAAVEFFVSIDPAKEPILTVKALESLPSSLPESMNVWLDRCASSRVMGTQEHLIRFMAAREDQKGLDYLLEMLQSTNKGFRDKALSYGIKYSVYAEEVGLAALASADPDLTKDLASRCSPRYLPRVWLALCQNEDFEIRIRVLMEYSQHLDRHYEAGMTLRRVFDEAEREVIRNQLIATILDNRCSERYAESLFTTVTNLGEKSAPYALAREPEASPQRKPLEELEGYLVELDWSGDELAQIAAKEFDCMQAVVILLTRNYREPGYAEALSALMNSSGVLGELFGSSNKVSHTVHHKLDHRHDQLAVLEQGFQILLVKDDENAQRGGAPDWLYVLQALVELESERVHDLCVHAFEAEPQVFRTWVGDWREGAEQSSDFYTDSMGRISSLPLISADLAKVKVDTARWLQSSFSVDVIGRILWQVPIEVGQDPTVQDAMRDMIVQETNPESQRVYLKALHRFGIGDVVLTWVPLMDGDDSDEFRRVLESLGERMFEEGDVASTLKTAIEQTPIRPKSIPATIWIKLADNYCKTGADWLAVGDYLVELVTNPSDDALADRKVVSYALSTIEKAAAACSFQDEWAAKLVVPNETAILRKVFGLLNAEQRAKHRDRLESLLTHAESEIRVLAIRAFVDERAGRVIVQFLDDPDERVRTTTLETLEQIRSMLQEAEYWANRDQPQKLSTVEQLIQQAEDQDPSIRLAAIRSLGALGDPQALPFLVEQLRNKDETLQAAAQTAIDRIVTGKETLNPATPQPTKETPSE